MPAKTFNKKSKFTFCFGWSLQISGLGQKYHRKYNIQQKDSS